MQWKPGMPLPAAVINGVTRLGRTVVGDATDDQYDARALIEQWADFRPRAMHHRQQFGCSNVEAWRRALNEVMGRRETTSRHRGSELMKILAPYATISVSDSVIERSFSRADQRIPAQARSMTESSEGIRMTALAMKPEDLPDLMPGVKAVWSELYPSSRSGGFDRIDRGRNHNKTAPPTESNPTESAFIRKRRAAACLVATPGSASAVAPATAAEAIVSSDAWTPNTWLRAGSIAGSSTADWSRR